MSVLKLLKKHLVDTQIYVAFMGSLFAVFFMLEQNTFRLSSAILIFITNLGGYLYTKYQYEKKNINKILIFNVIISIIGIAIIYKNLNIKIYIIWTTIIILGLLYNSFALANKVREIPLIKNFYIGLTWALIVFLGLETYTIWLLLLITCYISALVLPFDIRDLKNDKIITFPKLLGVKRTKQIVYFLLLSSNIIAFNILKTDYFKSFLIASIIASILTFFSSDDKEDFYYSFIVETCCGMPLIIYLLTQVL